jgi:hypothetical protein
MSKVKIRLFENFTKSAFEGTGLGTAQLAAGPWSGIEVESYKILKFQT